eukprot:GEZU01012816.1.p1 GENE.GEZU01012816.1~~GEZU01012816.1.p1  ORF type:complete len:379 (-),score=107.24 GEZU01012816.1:88-1224(-)
MADENGWKHKKSFDWENPIGKETLYFEGKMVPFTTDDPDVVKMFEVMDELTDPSKFNPIMCENDMSVFEYLVQRGVPSRVLNIADAVYAKTYNTCLSNLGVKEFAREEAAWPYGRDNYKLEGSFGVVIDHLKKDFKPEEIKLSWKVSKIEYPSGKKARVYGPGNQVIEADYVIITVPVSILRDEVIQFEPPLPEYKKQAAKAIKMDSAMKLYLKFKKPFWGANAPDLYLTDDPFFPQIWMLSTNGKEYGVCGFITGEMARTIAAMPEKDAVKLFLKTLDKMFGQPGNTTPATDSFSGYVKHDWSADPNVRGGYSYPSLNACGMRTLLAEPVGEKLFFAGEATNTRTASTVQAAMETGARAVSEIILRRNGTNVLLSKM